MSSLMASLTSAPPGRSGQVHSLPRLPRLDTNSSLDSEASCSGASYRLLSGSSCCSQVSFKFLEVKMSFG